MDSSNFLKIAGVIVSLFHICGAVTVLDALMTVRTSQGTIAWVISLLTFPYVSVPIYWVFGRNKFQGYIDSRRFGDREINHLVRQLSENLENCKAFQTSGDPGLSVTEKLVNMPFTAGNGIELLVNGSEAFTAMFRAIDQAEKYLLVQFFIVKNDDLGNELRKRLARKAKQGVRVCFLYDEVGSYKLSDDYINGLRAAGVRIYPFNTTKGWRNKFQLNFRNHRKVLVADGKCAFVGGLNIGDEYNGKGERFGHWRDTNIKMTGPSVLCVQQSFMEDWYWATHQVPELNWAPQMVPGDGKRVLVLPTGPADDLETCSLLFVHAINSARKRLWITTPYFVPDQQVLGALQLAALRGVDVRILLPQKADHILVYMSSYAFYREIRHSGVKIYRYQPGFMHQKVMLIDDMAASVGTANLDNRSFRLNFEISVLVECREFAARVRKMLEADFRNSRFADPMEYDNRSMFFKLAVRISHLLAPIQ